MKAHQVRVALFIVVVSLATAILVACGAPFEAATGAVDPGEGGQSEAGQGEASATPDGGTSDAAPAVDAMDGGVDAAGDGGPDAPAEWILCTTSSFTGSLGAAFVGFGCGLGWDAAKASFDSPDQLAELEDAGPYTITVFPQDGPPVRCTSTDPPAPQVGLCPWTVNTMTQSTWVRCVVSSVADGGVLGSGPSCQSEEAP